jgi:hypothetical protein
VPGSLRAHQRPLGLGDPRVHRHRTDECCWKRLPLADAFFLDWQLMPFNAAGPHPQRSLAARFARGWLVGSLLETALFFHSRDARTRRFAFVRLVGGGSPSRGNQT